MNTGTNEQCYHLHLAQDAISDYLQLFTDGSADAQERANSEREKIVNSMIDATYRVEGDDA